MPDAKAAVDKEREKLEKIPAWQLTKVRNRREVIDEARKEGKTVPFASLSGICHLKISELEPKFLEIQKVESYSEVTLCKRSVRLLRSVCRARFISITNDVRKSGGCHSETTRMRRTSSRRNITLHPG